MQTIWYSVCINYMVNILYNIFYYFKWSFSSFIFSVNFSAIIFSCSSKIVPFCSFRDVRVFLGVRVILFMRLFSRLRENDVRVSFSFVLVCEIRRIWSVWCHCACNGSDRVNFLDCRRLYSALRLVFVILPIGRPKSKNWWLIHQWLALRYYLHQSKPALLSYFAAGGTFFATQHDVLLLQHQCLKNNWP